MDGVNVRSVDSAGEPARTMPAVDLTNCDREPIHIPGSIQPHGVLIAFVEPALTIVSASANCAEVLGVAAERLTGDTLAAWFAVDDLERVREPGASDGLAGLAALPLTTSFGGATRHWTAVVHRHAGLAILELEPVNPPRSGPSTLLLVSAAARHLASSDDFVASCRIVAEQVRRVTGFDRVKVYRFATDWSGEVLAESRDDAMPSYLGLHFPATDIPVQARALYQSNPVRLISDVHYVPAPLRPDRDPATGGPIDLRFSTLRSVSPIHLEYLRNMGVGASMSASILRNGQLWGLIACHHRTPLIVDFERRQACALIAQLLAARLDAQQRMARANRGVRVESLRARVLQALADGESLDEAIEGSCDAWMALVDADGFALLRSDRVVAAGRTPPAAFLHDLAAWLATRPEADHFATDRLVREFDAAAAGGEPPGGVLAVPLSRSDGSFLLWFRPEQVRSVTWAGRPDKVEAARVDRIGPRHSFDAWTETVRGRSLAWSGQDVAAALQLRELLLELSVRERNELERRNVKLLLGARELETFIYVASHDIKEPLRQMEMLASLLREHVRDDVGADVEAEVGEYFREFKTVATRLRALTDQLAGYAKLGRADVRFLPVVLDELLEEVLVDFQPRLDAVEATWTVDGPLPTVLGEREQLHQVFANLIGNAIKYRAADRPLAIRVSARTSPDGHGDAGAGDASARMQMTRIAIADNGIGFDPKYGDKIFEAFWRLHSRDRYEGSGIGLAICRRIVERHRGRIDADARVDAGATFAFTLPLQVADQS